VTAGLRPVVKAATALLLALAAATCGGLTGKRTSSSVAAPSGWTEIKTAHFTIRSDLDRDTAEKAAVDFEAMFATLSDLAFISPQPPRANIDVIHFRRYEDFEVRAPKNAAAYFHSGMDYDCEFRSLVVLHGDLTNVTRSIIQHELTHFFVRHYYPQAPPWLNEGLAGYYESVVREAGVAILGRVSGFAFHRGPWQNRCRIEDCITLLPAPSARPLKELLALTGQDFSRGWGDDPRTLAAREAYLTNVTRRASATSLVRLLLHHPGYRPSFDAYLARLRQGERNAKAWALTLGKLPADKLEADLRASEVSFETPLLRTEYAPPRAAPEGVRELSQSEVHLLRAGLWNWRDDKERAAGRAELDRVDPSFRSTPQFVVMRASWSMFGGQATEARALLEAALQAHPEDPRLLNALGYTLLSTVAKDAANADAEAALQLVVDKLEPLARTAAQDHLIARARARKGALARAMAHGRRAISRDPNCVQCLASMAELFDRRGLVADALATALLADGLALEGNRLPELTEQIQRYQAKLAGEAGAKPAP
jgi:tetratricopeptide (TPR) repeat protein